MSTYLWRKRHVCNCNAKWDCRNSGDGGDRTHVATKCTCGDDSGRTHGNIPGGGRPHKNKITIPASAAPGSSKAWRRPSTLRFLVVSPQYIHFFSDQELEVEYTCVVCFRLLLCSYSTCIERKNLAREPACALFCILPGRRLCLGKKKGGRVHRAHFSMSGKSRKKNGPCDQRAENLRKLTCLDTFFEDKAVVAIEMHRWKWKSKENNSKRYTIGVIVN